MRKEFKAKTRSLGRPRVFFAEFGGTNSAHCADSLRMTARVHTRAQMRALGTPAAVGMTS